MSQILERVLDAIFRVDRKHVIKYISTPGVRWLGGTAPVIPQSFLDLIHKDDIESFTQAAASLPETFVLEVRLLKDQKPTWVVLKCYLMPVVNEYMVCVTDISVWKNSEIALLHASEHDSLTGLANRSLLNRTVNETINLGILTFYVALIDLDGFKKVNDTFGHAAGDEVLIEAGKRLSNKVGSSDLVCRLGGDEFAIVLSGYADIEEVTSVAMRMLQALARPFDTKPHEAYISGSIGLACYPDHGTDYASVLKSADSAMYRAKNSGKNRVCVYTEEAVNIDFSIKSAVHKGIQDGEFFMEYQPQYTTKGKLIGAEALMRWNSAEFGRVAPDKFISIVEETGLMGFLGDWALRYACHDLAKLLKKFPDFVMSVNVSPLQLNNNAFDRSVLSVLKETGIPSSSLVLEITESTLMKNRVELEQSLQALRKVGIKFSIDDFGTGFSSLAYLTRLPVSSMKIDKSFLNFIEVGSDADKQSNKKLIIAMINLAHSIELSCVAEGVETPTQLEFLRTHDCDHVQGYLLGKPMTVESLLDRKESL